VLVWDNLNTHLSAAMAELIAARDWLTVFQLPPYAHELNPAGLVWSHLKRSLANLAKRNIAQLTALVKTRLRRMQYRPALLEASWPAPAWTSHRSVTPRLMIVSGGGSGPIPSSLHPRLRGRVRRPAG
jgi:hypothetical protein